ncbi:MAG: SH3 domain-containing protein [Chloroflexi bacterium]|nr:SH3 domain-containing protein [Chloroflexota bacterium]
MSEDQIEQSNISPENPEQETDDSEPKVFAIEKDLSGGWQFSRRNFLASIGAAAVAGAVASGTSGTSASGARQSTGTFKAHLNDVTALAATPNGAILASISLDETVKLWSLEEPRGLFLTIDDHDAPPTALAISPDGLVLATADANGDIRLWALPEGEAIATLSVGGPVHRLAINPAGDTLASVDGDGQVILWSLPEGDRITEVATHEGDALDVAFSADGSMLVSAGGGTLSAWSLADERTVATMDGFATEQMWYTIVNNWVNVRSGPNTDDRILGSVPPGSILRVLNTTDSDWHQIIFEDEDEAYLAAWLTERLPALGSRLVVAPDASWVAAASNDGNVLIGSLPDGDLLATLGGHDQGISALALSPDGTTLATANGDGKIKLWAMPDGDRLGDLDGHDLWVNSLAFSPSGTHLVSGSNDNSIKVWSVSGGRADTLSEHRDNVNDLVITTDGRLLLSGSADDTIKIWEFPGGDYVADLFDLEATPSTLEGMTFRAPAPEAGDGTTEGAAGSSGSSSSGRTVVYTLPCGSAIPPGATCVCNCVAGSQPPPCSCVGYVAPTAVPTAAPTVCTCDTVCTCEGHCASHCSCVGYCSHGHYWYPN